jgi:hypothetical protein
VPPVSRPNCRGRLGPRRMTNTGRSRVRRSPKIVLISAVAVGTEIGPRPRTDPYMCLAHIRLVWCFFCQRVIERSKEVILSFKGNHSFVRPVAEHSSVPTAYFQGRRAQRWSRTAASSAPPKARHDGHVGLHGAILGRPQLVVHADPDGRHAPTDCSCRRDSINSHAPSISAHPDDFSPAKANAGTDRKPSGCVN